MSAEHDAQIALPRTKFGFSAGSALFYLAIVGIVGVFLYPLVFPEKLDTVAEKERISAETEDNTVRELAMRYGMTLSELEGGDWGNPWSNGSEARVDAEGNPMRPKLLGATGLFGRPLTPTYGALLGGRSDIRPLGGSRINPLAKRDRNLWPLNTDYDLYSLGRDGKTSRLLSSPESQDDIIRANNGQFVGLAADY